MSVSQRRACRSAPRRCRQLSSMARALARMVRRAFRDAELDEAAASAVALLALAAGQDVKPAEGSDSTDGRWPWLPPRC
jgi:hypothetical protein